ncbi:MAG TPA: VTT domain-containing protein [Allosphingosinicella sp.]|nr:VTT domain-containing protein [Allosphingosinicella sp.]
MASNISSLSLFRIGSAIILLLGLILIPFFLLGSQIEARTAALAASTQGAIIYGGAALLALDIVLPVPSSLLATAIGAALGPWLGTLVNAAGLTLGCAAGLMLGRSGAPLARSILGNRLYRRFAAGAAHHGIVFILVCRAVPVLGEASIVAAGAGRAPFAPALAAAAAANLVIGAAYAVAGTAPFALAAALAIGLPLAAGLCAWLWLRRPAAPAMPRPSPGAGATTPVPAEAPHP